MANKQEKFIGNVKSVLSYLENFRVEHDSNARLIMLLEYRLKLEYKFRGPIGKAIESLRYLLNVPGYDYVQIIVYIEYEEHDAKESSTITSKGTDFVPI